MIIYLFWDLLWHQRENISKYVNLIIVIIIIILLFSSEYCQKKALNLTENEYFWTEEEIRKRLNVSIYERDKYGLYRD
jgi:hypothetical protein